MYEWGLEQMHFFAESWPFFVRQFTQCAFKYDKNLYLRYTTLLSKGQRLRKQLGHSTGSICEYLHYYRHFVCSKLPLVVSRLHLAL